MLQAPNGTIYAVAKDGLQRSCDDGQTWEHIALPGGGHSYALAIANDMLALRGRVAGKSD